MEEVVGVVSQAAQLHRVFLLYGGMKEAHVCDRRLREATERAIGGCSLDNVVCLALDPVYGV